jgi:hypothetical protein
METFIVLASVVGLEASVTASGLSQTIGDLMARLAVLLAPIVFGF